MQEWLDAYEDRALLPSSPSITSSTEPTLFIADEHTVVSNDAANVISINSNSGSDDIEMTVSKIDKIRDRTDAMLNQQTFDVTVDEACVCYTCAEVVRILSLTDDEYYVPSSCFVNHTLRCVVTVFMARFEKLQWRLDMIEKVRNTIASQYKDTYSASCSSGG